MSVQKLTVNPATASRALAPFLYPLRRRSRGGSRIPTRILVVRLDEIGDVVLTSALLRELRRAFPSAWISLLVKPLTYNLVERCPHIDEVIVYPLRALRTSCGVGELARLLAYSATHLWPRRFDVALMPRWDVDFYHANWLGFLSAAARRIGYSEAVSEEKAALNRGHDWLLTDALKGPGASHEAERAMTLLEPLGARPERTELETWTDSDDEEFARNLLQSTIDSDGGCLVALCLSGRRPERRWPLASYASVGRWLQRTAHARLVILGGPGDEDLAREFRKQVPSGVIDTTNVATLRQTAAILKRCALYVGNDTGPMHIAAAAGTPVVEVSCHPESGDPRHPFSPVRFGPWRVDSAVVRPEHPRPPCEAGCLYGEPHCICEVSEPQVRAAITKILGQLPLDPRRRGLEP